jgi:hypothetical protein
VFFLVFSALYAFIALVWIEQLDGFLNLNQPFPYEVDVILLHALLHQNASFLENRFLIWGEYNKKWYVYPFSYVFYEVKPHLGIGNFR